MTAIDAAFPLPDAAILKVAEKHKPRVVANFHGGELMVAVGALSNPLTLVVFRKDGATDVRSYPHRPYTNEVFADLRERLRAGEFDPIFLVIIIAEKARFASPSPAAIASASASGTASRLDRSVSRGSPRRRGRTRSSSKRRHCSVEQRTWPARPRPTANGPTPATRVRRRTPFRRRSSCYPSPWPER